MIHHDIPEDLLRRSGIDPAEGSHAMNDDYRHNGHNPSIEIEAIRASSVQTKPVTWLWHGRIPEGKLTIFDGDPDLGKSVVTLDIAARVSSGRKFPDDATPGEASNVIICNVEDADDDTIVPRLKAHGADLDKVFLFSTVKDGKDGRRLLELPRDISQLENLIVSVDAALLIIDPVLTMIGGDTNKDQDARKALTPLADMAERTGVSVVAVRHLNKSVGLKAIQRGGGNMGLIGVARAGSFFAEHPDDNRLRIMAPHKSNLAEKLPSLSYRITTSPIHDTARVEWTGATEYDANALAAEAKTPGEKSELDAAKEFLMDELEKAPMWSKQIFKDAHDAGIAQKTLYRAKAALGVKSEKVGLDGWAWKLPNKGSQKKTDDHVDYVDHLQNNGHKKSPESAYLYEGGQGGQDGQGSQDAAKLGYLPNSHRRLAADEETGAA